MRAYVHMHKSTCGMQVEEAHFYIYKTTSQHTQKNWGHGNSLSQIRDVCLYTAAHEEETTTICNRIKWARSDSQTYSGSGYNIRIKLLNTIFYPESSPIRAEMHKESHLLHIGCQWQDSLAVAPFSARKYPSAEARSRHSQLEYFIAPAC